MKIRRYWAGPEQLRAMLWTGTLSDDALIKLQQPLPVHDHGIDPATIDEWMRALDEDVSP